MTDKLRETYKEEAYELLAELETSLLELEENPDNLELIGRVFRAMHTIKGSGAMFGFDDIAAFTHEVETIFDLVRNGKLNATKELIDLTLAARDQIRAMLDASDGNGAVDAAVSETIVAGLKRLAPTSDKTEAQAAISSSQKPEVKDSNSGDKTSEITYRIRFRPSADLFVNGTNPIPLLNELRELGSSRVIAHTDAIPVLEDMNPEICSTYWDIILTTDKGINAIKDVFIFVEDSVELKIEVIDQGWADGEAGDYKKLGQILTERGDVKSEDIDNILGRQKRLGELLVDAGVARPGQVASALVEQQHVKEIREKRQTVEAAASIRVPSERLDSMVNLVGELVTVQARLTQAAALRKDPELAAIAEEVERLSGDLRDKTMSIRMLQIGTTFSKFKRLVRDLSKELGKEIELTTSGAETELDKTVIEKLNDPLVHLIRNCIDHGIESPEEREKEGKPRIGNVHLSAVHSGASVLIDIADDGKGLNAAAIRAKAIEKGLISAEAALTEKELFNLILAPGFSTAKTVTSVSGRGVGMDVVKRAIDELRGSIEISSWAGQGSTITLKLPLTLAIIEGLLVRISGNFFVLPLSSVEECVELTREDSERAHGRNMANVRGQIIPYIRLRDQFMIIGEPPAIEQIVIARVDGNRVGFVVDGVIGEHQTVIKSLGRAYRDVEGISGATILGDGTVALILDTSHLVATATLEEQTLVQT
ncbi:MAG: chemotaxis protein CheA [Thermodesulfovibrio sp.]|nr:chemotaxis protein CheA [Thermodesulfovibrio sp.]